jgi:hypothetical protein
MTMASPNAGDDHDRLGTIRCCGTAASAGSLAERTARKGRCMPDFVDRDPEDDTKAREWAEQVRRDAAAELLFDDSEALERKLAEERAKLTRR